MKRTTLILAVVAAGVSGSLTWGGHLYVQQSRGQEAVRLRAENDRLRHEIIRRSETLRAEANSSRAAFGSGSSADSAAAASQAIAVAADQPTTRAHEIFRTPGKEYRQDGQATPMAALQTFAWACDRGDEAAMLKLICYDEAARAKAMVYMAGLPAEMRARWNTPEAMAAAVLTADGIEDPYPGATILALAETKTLADDRVALLMPGTSRERTEFQKTAEGWKYAITEKAVDDYIAESNAPRP